ncbi:hypothetical protein CMV_000959 [Castanea mollissima]|uniref:Uncharacterized protein n=1 Tax=Castanea mollissima TaxID=60419 RepID=A0A8J4VXA2_9ROSI|nr:hypothetical protein CMV_000959 [Castanea mollissima]
MLCPRHHHKSRYLQWQAKPQVSQCCSSSALPQLCLLVPQLLRMTKRHILCIWATREMRFSRHLFTQACYKMLLAVILEQNLYSVATKGVSMDLQWS